MTIDRNKDLEDKRKIYQSQNLPNISNNEDNDPKIKKNNQKNTTSVSWRAHDRNKTKSMINFLQNTKTLPTKIR